MGAVAPMLPPPMPEHPKGVIYCVSAEAEEHVTIWGGGVGGLKIKWETWGLWIVLGIPCSLPMKISQPLAQQSHESYT